MEEKKNSNVVNMQNEEERPEKMSYEQLENIAHQLSEQSKQLYAQLQEANMINVFKRLDYLFKVVENNTSFDDNFLHKCIDEIESIMTVPKEREDNSEE